jgi:hypothetical protein
LTTSFEMHFGVVDVDEYDEIVVAVVVVVDVVVEV